jgi:predicted transcriptional regulator
MADLEDIRARLEGIAEELSDMALDVLREAVDQGADKRPDLEKRLTRARSSVEKAARLLAD